MDKFVLPSIPRIHVPTSSTSDHKPKEGKKRKDPKYQKDTVAKKDDGPAKKILETPPPKLCPSCSKVLLEYLIPLQQYINHVVEITIEECGLKHVATQITGQATGLRIPAAPSHNALSPKPSSGQEALQENSRTVNETSQRSDAGAVRTDSTEAQVKAISHGNREAVQQTSGYPSAGRMRTSDYPRNSEKVSRHGNNEKSHDGKEGASFKMDKSFKHDRDQSADAHSHDSGHLTRENHKHESSTRYESSGDTGHRTDYGHGENHDGHHEKVRNSTYAEHGERRQSSGHGRRSQSAERPESYFNQPPSEGQRDRSFTIPGPPVIQEMFSLERNEKFGSNEAISSSGYEDPSCEDHASSKFEPQSRHHSSEQLLGHNDSQEDLTEFVNAYVTIIYNNLSAINAIILANSLIITRKSPTHVPFIVLIGGKIDPILRSAVDSVFDQVINIVQDFRLSLISNLTLGQQPLKFQLWKVLNPFEKCLFIESACIVVSDISHVFDQFNELSACVDWIFPDFFSCSVFVMEPNEETYNNLVKFAAEANEDSYRDFDEGIDEMVVLNQFFASKWNKVSFVYNFVPNSAVYTQTPAFLKFGGDVKIVNFGYSTVNASGSKGSSQPWHVMFDLSVNDHVSTTSPTDNFSMFYLDIFLKRLWPLLQQTLTPLLLARIGKREWSVYELTRFLSIGSETDELMYNPISMRRKPAVITTPQVIVTKEEGAEINEIDLSSQSITSALPPEEKKNEIGDELEQPKLETKSEDEVEEILDETEGATALVTEESIESKMRPWDTGSIDWMGVHKSDKIIERLMGMMKE